MPGEKLTDEVKTYIVQALACFDTPSVVAKAVKDEFAETVSRQQVECYDPNKRQGAGLSERWRTLFAATREAFLADTAAIGISHRAVRLRTLQRLADRAEGMGAIALAAQFLEQAAKEAGGAFTNRRELTGKDGAPLATAAVIIPADLSGLSVDELTKLYREAVDPAAGA